MSGPDLELSRLWEKEPLIRDRLRDKQSLLAWPTAATVGVASMPAVAMNWKALMVLAEFHCPLVTSTKARAPSVIFLKVQAWCDEIYDFYAACVSL